MYSEALLWDKVPAHITLLSGYHANTKEIVSCLMWNIVENKAYVYKLSGDFL